MGLGLFHLLVDLSSVPILLHRCHLYWEPSGTQCNEDRFWKQDQIEDTWVLKTDQGTGFDDLSAKLSKIKASLWEVSEKRMSLLQKSFAGSVLGLD